MHMETTQFWEVQRRCEAIVAQEGCGVQGQRAERNTLQRFYQPKEALRPGARIPKHQGPSFRRRLDGYDERRTKEHSYFELTQQTTRHYNEETSTSIYKVFTVFRSYLKY